MHEVTIGLWVNHHHSFKDPTYLAETLHTYGNDSLASTYYCILYEWAKYCILLSGSGNPKLMMTPILSGKNPILLTDAVTPKG